MGLGRRAALRPTRVFWGWDRATALRRLVRAMLRGTPTGADVPGRDTVPRCPVAATGEGWRKKGFRGLTLANGAVQ